MPNCVIARTRTTQRLRFCAPTEVYRRIQLDSTLLKIFKRSLFFGIPEGNRMSECRIVGAVQGPILRPRPTATCCCLKSDNGQKRKGRTDETSVLQYRADESLQFDARNLKICRNCLRFYTHNPGFFCTSRPWKPPHAIELQRTTVVIKC